MHFLPTDEQRELQHGVREVLERAFPLSALDAGFDPRVWQTLVDTGVFALRTELGLGLADAALVFQELGRAAVPGPLVGTFLAAGLDDAIAGGPVALLEPDVTPLLVTDLDVSSRVLVLDPAGPRLVAVADVVATAVPEPLDPLSPVHEIAALDGGLPAGDAATTTRLRREGAVLTAALQVGLADRLTSLAVDYAGTREQFGKPIGTFQAVKHLCADMLVRTELARAAVDAAAVRLDDAAAGDIADGGFDVDRAVSAAKVVADDAATANGRSCVQVHGGMGFTWEVPVHFLLKRAWVHATELGSADEHAEALADRL